MSTDAQARAFPVSIGGRRLEGEVAIPDQPAELPPLGLVIFAHGSGSSRFSPRNRRVARQLQSYGLATLLFDLLTEAEAQDRDNVFNVSLLADRVIEAIRFAHGHAELSKLPLGLLGASTGAAAALIAAARLPRAVAAVVSRGGRPDLAVDALERVCAPTLLIVGGADREVLALNRVALKRLACEKRLEIVPGATHLFEEPGALDAAAALAGRWLQVHFRMLQA